MNSVATASITSAIGVAPAVAAAGNTSVAAIVIQFFSVLVALLDCGKRYDENKNTSKKIKLNISRHASLRFAVQTKGSKLRGFAQTNSCEAMTK